MLTVYSLCLFVKILEVDLQYKISSYNSLLGGCQILVTTSLMTFPVQPVKTVVMVDILPKHL